MAALLILEPIFEADSVTARTGFDPAAVLTTLWTRFVRAWGEGNVRCTMRI